MTTRQGSGGEPPRRGAKQAPAGRSVPPSARQQAARQTAPRQQAVRPAAARRVRPRQATIPTGVHRTGTTLSRTPRTGSPRTGPAHGGPPRRPRKATTRTVPLGSPGTRLRIGLFAVAFLLSLFAGRLLQLQGVDASQYAIMADTERRITQTLTASRGTISDRDGVPLAVSIDAVNVFADQTVVDNPALTARMLSPYIDVPVEDLEERLTGDAQFKYLAKDLDQATWAKVDDLDLSGIHGEVIPRRSYPGDTLAANVVGFVGAEGTGLAGIEQLYDARLQGQDGETTYLRDGSGRRIPSGAASETAPVAGQGVQLTIDQDLQWVAQSAIAAKVEEAGAVSGTVVVMSPDGKILAMATAPTFDPNRAGSADPALLGNRAVEQVYEPGSIQKALTAAAVLEEAAATPGTVFEVADRIVIDGEDYGDHSPHATGRWTFANIIAESSNVGTIMAADPLSGETLYGYLRAFGLGEPTGLELPGESVGIVADPATWYESTRHTIAFGQGLSANAVQMASVYATIANDGVRVEPTVVEGFVHPDGDFEAVTEPEQRRVVSEQTARQVSQMLEMVVTEGTGKVGAIEGYNVAGKTGTAQYSDPGCGGCYRGYTASYAGFAPADDPQLVVSVTLQQPVNGYYGGVLGGPVFNEVMSYGLQALSIPPTGAAPAALPLFESEPVVEQ